MAILKPDIPLPLGDHLDELRRRLLWPAMVWGAVFVAAFCDGVDGRIARMTNTQSAFGVQYDSLSDLISFGLAPALIMYNWSLIHLLLLRSQNRDFHYLKCSRLEWYTLLQLLLK